jgi:hypothetical protein
MSVVNSVCKVDRNNFCYVCGKYRFKKQLIEIDQKLQDAYEKYFDKKIHVNDIEWSPSLCCSTCKIGLSKWTTGNGGMPFAKPMKWKKPRNHRKDCYFCSTLLPRKISSQTINQIVYPTVASVDFPTPHTASKPIPNPPGGSSEQTMDLSSSTTTKTTTTTTTTNTTSGSNYGNPRYKKPYNQNELNDLIRDLNLNKDQSELLASRLKERGFVDDNTKVTFYRQRNNALVPFFKQYDKLSYCDDVAGLFSAMNQPYQPNEWRLFIDSSSESLVATLVHIGNVKPSIPLG